MVAFILGVVFVVGVLGVGMMRRTPPRSDVGDRVRRRRQRRRQDDARAAQDDETG